MRIEPIKTTNYNTPFKKLVIATPPKQWDVEILGAVVNNAEIRAYARHLDSLKKDLMLTFCTIGKDYFSVSAGTDYHDISLISEAPNKTALLDKLAKFNFKSFLAKKEEDKETEAKRDSLLRELDKFNEQLG